MIVEAMAKFDLLALGFGLMSGSVPAEQHTRCPGANPEQSLGSELYLVKSEAEIPHFEAKEPQLSPEATV
jgi:hypothetical protein